MTRDEIRQYCKDNPIDWPPLSPSQRARLAAILRPDASIVRPLRPLTERRS